MGMTWADVGRIIVVVGGVIVVGYKMREQVGFMGDRAPRILTDLATIILAVVAVVTQGVLLGENEVTWRLPVTAIAITLGVIGVTSDHDRPPWRVRRKK